MKYIVLGLLLGFLLIPPALIAWFVAVSPKPILCDGGMEDYLIRNEMQRSVKESLEAAYRNWRMN